MADLSSQNRGHEVLAVTVALLVLSTVAVVLRLVSRVGIVKRVSIDDYFMILAWVISFGFSFSICYGTSKGLGRHGADVLLENKMALRKAEYAFSVLYNPALMATKTSICLFYLTLAKNHRTFKWTTVATLVVVNVAGVALTFLNIFQCRPVGAGFEDPVPPNSKCIDIIALYLSSAPINIITDLALLFLPMPILTGMRLPRNEKLILIVTFSFGGFVAVVDVVRIAYLQDASKSRLKGNGSSLSKQGDFSWIASLSFMWSAIEVDVGIMCACVPGIKPLAARVFPNLLGRIKHARNMSGNHYYGPGDAQWADVAPANNIRASLPGSPTRPRPVQTLSGSKFHASDNTQQPNQDRIHNSSAMQRRSPDGPRIDSMNSNVDAMEFLTTPEMTFGDNPQPESAYQGEVIGFEDFLNGPSSPTYTKTDTTLTVNTTKARKGSLTVFDFVNVNNPKCMVRMSNRESFPFLCLVTVLFFLWGCAYGLLATLNSQFQEIVKANDGQNIGLHAAYFGAYFVGPLTFGRPVFKKGGFKTTFIVGLCIYGTGTLVFWPSAVLLSYPAFLVCNVIVGLGVSTLEVAGNPFIALCGPPQYAETRLNVSQGVQAIGSVVSPILAKKVLFKGVTNAPSLIDIQWTYLGIAVFDVILALVFYYLPIPEASDEELQDLADERSSVNTTEFLGVSIVYVTLAFGILSNFCYVGGQEALAGVFLRYVDTVRPRSSIGAFDYQTVGHTVFAVGRFLSALAGLLVEPRWILMSLYLGSLVTSILAMNLTGYAGVAMVILIMLFESGIFSIVFAMCIRGLGSHTKTGSVLLTASTSGGAIIPAIMYPVDKSRSIPYGISVIVAMFAFGMLLPLYTIVVPAAKRQINTIPLDQEIDSNLNSSWTTKRFGLAMDAITRRSKPYPNAASTEHVEKVKDEAPG